MRAWTARQWIVAATSAVAIALIIGVATAIIDTPFFVRMIPTPWWAYPIWIVSAVLMGLLIATYVAPAESGRPDDGRPERRRSLGGAVLAFFAVGCPTCNVLVVAALGVSGAVTWFQPVQPFLGLASVLLLAWALRSRLRTADNCPVPAASADGPAERLDEHG